jgi:uncharacterized protein
MDRIFLDANVLFVASYREGAELSRLWKLPGIRLLTSTYALIEVFRNVNDAAQRVRLAELVASIELVTEKPEGEAIARSVGLPDKDVPILHAAISGQATHLLTADRRHFGRLYSTQISGVLILAPAEYLRAKDTDR